MSTQFLAERLAQACQRIRDAIQAKQALAAYYRGVVLVFSPHVLGQRGDGQVLLAFVTMVEPLGSGKPSRATRLWRWLQVADFHGLAFACAPWRTAPPDTRPALEDCTVEVEAA